MIRVVLPAHLRNLAKVDGELELEVEGPATQRSVLDALEARYPMLCGTLRDHVTQQRRPFVRFFACEEDLSHDSPDKPLPPEVASGAEPFLIVGAIAGVYLQSPTPEIPPVPGRSNPLADQLEPAPPATPFPGPAARRGRQAE
jgi:hypothetical protein